MGDVLVRVQLDEAIRDQAQCPTLATFRRLLTRNHGQLSLITARNARRTASSGALFKRSLQTFSRETTADLTNALTTDTRALTDLIKCDPFISTQEDSRAVELARSMDAFAQHPLKRLLLSFR
jgi:hypothetical protein